MNEEEFRCSEVLVELGMTLSHELLKANYMFGLQLVAFVIGCVCVMKAAPASTYFSAFKRALMSSQRKSAERVDSESRNLLLEASSSE